MGLQFTMTKNEAMGSELILTRARSDGLRVHHQKADRGLAVRHKKVR